MPRVERAIGKQFDTFVKVAKTQGFDTAKANVSRIITPEPIQDAIGKIYKTAALNEASHIYGQLKKIHLKFMGFGFNEQWTQLVQQYLGNIELLNTVQGITETTKERILKVIADGIENGLSVDDIVAKLQSDEYTTARARRIVRTESVGATNVGSMIGAMSTGIMYQKEWISALDHRVRGSKPKDRFSHIALNGDVVDMEKGFNNGEVIRYPGDKKASAGNIIQCRCTMGFIPKRDSNGRIMRYDSQPLQSGEMPIKPNNEMSGVLLQIIAGTILGQAVGSLVSDFN
jgi:hypothetical protein